MEELDTAGALTIDVQSNTAKPSGNSSNNRLIYVSTPSINSADMETSVKVIARPTAIAPTIILLLVRYVDVNNFYACAFDSWTGGSVYYYKAVNGVYYDVGTAAASGIATNDTLTCRISGNTLSSLRNGFTISSATVDGVTLPGKGGLYFGIIPGIWSGPTISTTWQLDDYVAKAITEAPASMPLTFSGSVVLTGVWTNSPAQNTTLNTFKSYAKILITPWASTAGGSWCNAALSGATTITKCGPYMDFGFTFTNLAGGCCSATEWAAVSQYQLDSTYSLYANPANSEAVMDWRNSTWVDLYKGFLVNGWTVHHAAKSGTGMNTAFFDNGFFDGQVWWWTNSGGVTRAAWKTAMLDAITSIQTYYAPQGDSIVLNGWSDLYDYDLWVADTAYYRNVANQVQYILYEQTTTSPSTGASVSSVNLLRSIDMAFDFNTNTNATMLWSTEYGDFWYNFVTGLFSCTSTKCGFWQQPVMSSTNITKTTTLNLGVPAGNYGLAGCHYRNFTRGVAVANTGTSSCTFTLMGGFYTDWIAGGTVSGVQTLPAHSGKIYITQ